jgi:FtsH-binding integral membrane protein
MATASRVSAPVAKRLPGRRYDHVFFTAIIVIMLGAVFLGFARTFFLADMYKAPPLTPILQIHGAVFSLWMLVLLAQTTLVAASRVDLHRKLGMAGFILSCLMVVMGVLAAADFLGKGSYLPHPPDVFAFTVVPLTAISMFAVLIGLAYRTRKDSATHKRLVILAMTGPIVAAIARWPFPWLYRNVDRATFVSLFFILALVLYDLWSTRKIHRATLWGSVFVILIEGSRDMIGATQYWHTFARWMQSWNI